MLVTPMFSNSAIVVTFWPQVLSLTRSPGFSVKGDSAPRAERKIAKFTPAVDPALVGFVNVPDVVVRTINVESACSAVRLVTVERRAPRSNVAGLPSPFSHQLFSRRARGSLVAIALFVNQNVREGASGFDSAE